ncbi:MAG: hypothetical protein CMJ77_08045 [Planctomycetaceae bacterium]|nr:hypothetical protein [Planctomycetaceae bacterium]
MGWRTHLLLFAGKQVLLVPSGEKYDRTLQQNVFVCEQHPGDIANRDMSCWVDIRRLLAPW